MISEIAEYQLFSTGGIADLQCGTDSRVHTSLSRWQCVDFELLLTAAQYRLDALLCPKYCDASRIMRTFIPARYCGGFGAFPGARFCYI